VETMIARCGGLDVHTTLDTAISDRVPWPTPRSRQRRHERAVANMLCWAQEAAADEAFSDALDGSTPSSWSTEHSPRAGGRRAETQASWRCWLLNSGGEDLPHWCRKGATSRAAEISFYAAEARTIDSCSMYWDSDPSSASRVLPGRVGGCACVEGSGAQRRQLIDLGSPQCAA
jgi:hypothetical protein